MPEVVIYTLLGVLLVSQLLSFVLHWSHSPRQVQRAFEMLENDFENLNDHVGSQLGRIARLRRANLEVATREQEPPDESPTAGGFRLTPQQRKLQAEILARRGNKPS